MTKPPILMLHPLTRPVRTSLDERHTVIGPSATPLQALAESGLAEQVRVAITVAAIGLKPEIMEALPALELVCFYGAGYDGVDLAALKARGIRLTNTRGGNASCVADMAMALLLSVVRRLREAETVVRDGKWDRIPPRGWGVRQGFGGHRLDILGLGEIGLKIAMRAAGFELDIAYHNRTRRRDVDYPYFDNPEALAAWADYLVIACPLSEETRHIVDAKVLAALGPRGYLVNIARGAVVDEAALITALESGAIAGAGLDVFEHEPEVPAALRNLGNVVLTPHVAALTARALAETDRQLLANLEAFYAGKALLTPVTL